MGERRRTPAFFALGEQDPGTEAVSLAVGEATDGPYASFFFWFRPSYGYLFAAGLRTRGRLDELWLGRGEAAGSIVVHDNATATAYLVAHPEDVAIATERLLAWAQVDGWALTVVPTAGPVPRLIDGDWQLGRCNVCRVDGSPSVTTLRFLGALPFLSSRCDRPQCSGRHVYPPPRGCHPGFQPPR